MVVAHEILVTRNSLSVTKGFLRLSSALYLDESEVMIINSDGFLGGGGG